MDKQQLCMAAQTMRDKAYAPYSNFTVGAALLGESGTVYTGCNIENAAFSPTVCAERVAFFKAISEGEKDFIAIAIAGGSGDSPNSECPPCGVCRQVMAEFCDPHTFKVFLAKSETDYIPLTLNELLPYGFGKGNI